MDVGVCYFPEHWPSENMDGDIEQMADSGIEYVRMAEFAWSEFESEPGEYDFEWLERAVSLIDDYGMKAVLCTPTASPPKWLVDEYPSIRQQEDDGTTREFGSRRHYCFNSEIYRRESRRIVGELAERFADDETVVGWQTDNEYGWAGTLHCYCDDCASAFREWLREKYGDIETLNERWGTEFWSQEYNSFAQIEPPRHTPGSHHPSKLLEYDRFSSDSVVEYNREQVEILKEYNDEWFVTHNFMSHDALNAFDVSDDLDFASWDAYPTGHVQVHHESVSPTEYRVGDPDHIGVDHDLYRNAAEGAPWVMEQQAGEIDWPPHSPQPGEGAMRLWAHYAAAHGTDVVSYFRWRKCRSGQEQYHSGLLSYDGSAGRGHRDAETAAAEFEDLAAELGGTPALPEADVALVHDYDSLWALDIEPHAPDFDYWQHLETYYGALRERGITVDIVPPSTDLSQYEAVVTPTLYLVDDALADRLESYVAEGGELLVTMRSGVKDPYNKLHNRAQPGPLADLVGTHVVEFETVPESLQVTVTYDGTEFDCRTWNEWLAGEETATVRGRFNGDLADGRPAIVHNARGDGSVTYVGTWPSADLASAIVGDLLERTDVEMTAPLPDGVRLAQRGGTTWIANFTDELVSVDAPGDATWRLGDSTVEGFDVAVTDSAPSELHVETTQ